MVFAIIPKICEDELLTKPEYTQTYHDIIQWCRNKTQLLRTRELANFTRRPTGPSSRANTLRGSSHEDDAENIPVPVTPPRVEEEIPSCARDIIAAVRSQPSRQTPPPPKKPTGPGTERPKRTDKAPAKRPPDHSRSGGRDGKGAKCPIFAKLLKDGNPGVTERKKMKVPAGYQGAYEKALISAGGKPRRLNYLED